MRLKTLRKERPTFETEGAVISGSRIDLSNGDLKPAKHRSDNLFVLPTSLNSELSSQIISSSQQTIDMTNRSRQKNTISEAAQSSNISSYQAIEAAYLERGIRIRLSPTKPSVTGQQSGRKSVNSLQQHTAFINRKPSRTSSVLQYATTNLDQHHDSRSFSALQETSSNDFEQTHNVSYAQSSQMNEEIHKDYYSPSIIASEQSNTIISPENLPITNDITSVSIPYDNDPDLAYMSLLLKKPSGDSYRDTIRRRAGLRGTFAVHRHSLTTNPIQLEQQSREKSPIIHRNSVTRHATITVVPISSPKKIDTDILKHASRIRRASPSKDYFTKPFRIDATPITSSSPRAATTNNNNRRNSTNKPLKSISLEPLEIALTPAPRSASLLRHDLPVIKTSSITRNSKSPIKRAKSAKISSTENQNSTQISMKEHSNLSSILQDESLALMRTSPLDIARQSNSYDSGYYDRSSSSGDIQSLTSSSIMRISSSIPSARLTNSAARRSNTNKKVSFYDEPTTVILTTATYV